MELAFGFLTAITEQVLREELGNSSHHSAGLHSSLNKFAYSSKCETRENMAEANYSLLVETFRVRHLLGKKKCMQRTSL
jgi:hypothetical protein